MSRGSYSATSALKLRAEGVPVRGIVRRREQADNLAAAGVEARLADLGNRASLAEALRGAEQLFLITAATPQQAEHGTNAVHAAKDAGVRAIMHLSGADNAERSPLPWGRAIWQINSLVRSSGLEWTILHASGFMTNLEPSAAVIRRGFFPQTMGRGRIPWIDTADIARVATRLLHEGVHEGAEPVLTGPELLDGAGVARALSSGLDRRVRYVHLPSRAFAGVLRLSGVDAWPAEGLRQQFGRVARHGLDRVDVMTDDVERLTGQAPRAMRDWARAQQAALLGEPR